MICPRCKKDNDEKPIIVKEDDHYHCKNCDYDWVDAVVIQKVHENQIIPESRSKHFFLQHPDYNKRVFEDCIMLQKKAIGKIKVGCVVEAYEFRDNQSHTFEFFGCNIHVSDSFGDTHAERMAIDLALQARCYPITIYVTSTSSDEKVLLCGSCRHYISEINENCNIVIFNPDGTIKDVSSIKESYPHHKDVKRKNKKFFELCGGMIQP